MKTETLLLYSCLSMALLSLLGQIIMMMGQRNNNFHSPLRLSNDFPAWLKQIPLNTWMETRDHKICGWFMGQTGSVEIQLKTDLESIIHIPKDRMVNEVWMVAPYPHIRLFTASILYEKMELEDLTTFFEQEVSVLQRPKFVIQMKHEQKTQIAYWHIHAWILESQWLDFQQRWVLQNKLPTTFEQHQRTDYHA
ncbi:MAG: hypothetical protein QE271_14555 [Bacteriovoracaceae bacterium]|nr:hypothetical protein [Bacteriovoracaceae bacterium]